MRLPNVLAATLVISLIAFGSAKSANLTPSSGRPTSLLCGPNIAVGTDSYQKIRNLLLGPTLDEKGVGKVEQLLIHDGENCKKANGTALFAELFRLVGNRWRTIGALRRADTSFDISYKHAAGTQNNLLGQISTLQDWSRLKVQMNDASGARRLASLQSSLARRAYLTHKFGSSLAVSSIYFEAAILNSIGDFKAASRKSAEAAALSRKSPECKGLCAWKSN
jgi:hypothetical protein